MMNLLQKRGIITGIHYLMHIHQQPAYNGHVLHSRSIHTNENLAKCLLSLRLYPELGEQMQQQVIEAVMEFQEST